MDAFILLKGKPKFGSHFLRWSDNISIGGDFSIYEIESDYSIPNENTKDLILDVTKKKVEERGKFKE